MSRRLPESLHRLARLKILDSPTPIQRLSRLEAALGDELNGVRIFAKRDDHMLVGGGGNKLRKLEFLLGEALAQGADTIITVGGIQSNHARLTAAACAREGLACELILGQAVPRDDRDYQHNGNVLLDGLFGANVKVLAAGESTLAVAEQRANELRAQGRKVAVFPTGGSTAVGALGYTICAEEIQQAEQEFAKVIVPNGSSGTHAGLVAGFSSMGIDPRIVRSYAVLGEAQATADTTLKLANGVLQLLGCDAVEASAIEVDGAHRGSGYGIPTEGMFEAVRLMARSEGLLLDPVYSGKAFAGMLHDIRNKAFKPGDNLLFVMTGGAPGLYAYREAFQA
jgi:L-cysteate sulfo-lyase